MLDTRDKDFQATPKDIISLPSTNVHISKSPKDHYQIVIKRKWKDDDKRKSSKRGENKNTFLDNSVKKREIHELEVNN